MRPTPGEWENGLRIDIQTEAVVTAVELEERKSRARPRPGLEERLAEARLYFEKGDTKDRDSSTRDNTPVASVLDTDEKSVGS